MAIPNPQVAATSVNDQRLDIDGSTWQLNSITNESVTLYTLAAASGTSYKIGYLAERPATANFTGGNAAPAVAGKTLVVGLTNINAASKFHVDYDRAFVVFDNSVSSPVNVTYSGMGSIQRAKDINESLLANEWAVKTSGTVTGTSEYSAKKHATDAATSFTNFRNDYLGDYANDSAANAGGATVAVGSLYFNTTTNKLKVCTNASGTPAWANATSAVEGVATITEFSPNGTDSHFAFSHDVGLQIVWLNGVRLIQGTDYLSVNSGSSTSNMTSGTASHIYFASVPQSGDVLSAMGFGTVTSTAVVPVSGGTFTGAISGTDLTLSGNLTVSGTTTTVDTTVTISDAMVVNNAGTDVGLKINSTSSGHIMQLQDNGTDVMVVKDGGNVGVGTSSPSSILNLHNGTGSDGDGARETKLTFSGEKSNGSVKRTGSIKGVHDGTGSDDLGRLEFEPGETGTKMTIDSSGNIGIGTDSPTSDGGTTLEIYNASTPTLRLNDGGDYKALVQLRGNDTEIRGSSGNMEFYTGNADGASSTNRMTINSSGNVGIGTDSPGTNRLYVAKQGAGEYVAKFENTQNNSGSGIHIVSANTSPGGQEAIKLDVNSVQKCLLTMQGNLTIAGSYSPFTATHIAKIPDYNSDYQYGELVEIVSISSSGFDVSYVARKTQSSYQKNILGAFRELQEKSDTEIVDPDEDKTFSINVLGDGHILCNSENGNIEIGDGIASSSTAGQGMKADSGTYIFGIAQENYNFTGSETKLIAVQYGMKKY